MPCCSSRCRSPRPTRLVDVFTSDSTGTVEFSTSSYPDYLDLSAQNDVFDGAGRLQPDVRGAQPRRPLAPGDGRDRHRQLLPGVRRQRRARPHDSPVRRCAGRAEGGDGVAPLLGARARLGARRGRPHACGSAARRTPSSAWRRRRSAAWCRSSRPRCGFRCRRRSTSSRSGCTTRCRRRPARRGSIAAPIAGCSCAAGSSRARRSSRRARTSRVLASRLAADNPATNRDRHIAVKPTSDVHFHPSLDPVVVPIAAGADGRGRPRAADRVRQRREHAAGARVEPAQGDRHPPRDRREPRPADAPARHRSGGAVAARRGRRRRCSPGGSRRSSRRSACRCRFRSPSICGSTAACSRSRSAPRSSRRCSPGLAPALQATKPSLIADLRGEVERVAGRRPSLDAARRAGRRPDGDHRAAAGRRRAADAQLHRGAAHQRRASPSTGSRSSRPTPSMLKLHAGRRASASTSRRSPRCRRFPASNRRRSPRACRCS